MQLLKASILDAQTTYTEISELGDRIALMQIVVVALCVALGCASGLMVMQLLTPVSQMIEASRAISRSQFDTPDIPLPKQPEIGQLAESFNRMKHSMAQQVSTLQEKNEIERELHRQKTEALELQNRMERSRLQQLRSQIDPHFLFNTLNVIQQMAGTESAYRTQALIMALSHLLRYSLMSNDEQVPLSREVRVVDEYYSIYHVRFGDRVQMEWAFSDSLDLTETMVPSFILQPIVENAFKHGICPKEEGGVVRIRMIPLREKGLLCIRVLDNGVGWMRGGMAMVNIVASYFFGGISGSASADTASIGSIMIPMMVDQGYGADFSTAVTITSSCEGLLVPPSHNMVIYATTAGGISVGSLFLAGYLPGALLAIVLMIGSYIISVKRNYPKGDPFSIKAFVKQLGTSIWALAAVIIVVFGVVGGVFTATESAAIAVIYSLLVSVFVYKGLDWKGVWHALDECVNTLSIVLILIATSAVFGNCLTMLHVPDLAATAITDLTDNPYIIALLIDLILLVLGMIMDMAPIILIATPILLPIATSIGIDPIQFGIIVVLNCGIGLLTPPVGSVLFIGSAVAKRPMEKVVKATLPFYLCMFIALLLLTYIPDISLAIPKLLGGYVSPIANPLGPVFIH